MKNMKTKILKNFAILSLSLMGLFFIGNNLTQGQIGEISPWPVPNNGRTPKSFGPHKFCCCPGANYCSASIWDCKESLCS